MKNLVSIILILILSSSHSVFAFAESDGLLYSSKKPVKTNLQEDDQSTSSKYSKTPTNNLKMGVFSTGDPNDDDSTLGGVEDVPIDVPSILLSILIFSYFLFLFYKDKTTDK